MGGGAGEGGGGVSGVLASVGRAGGVVWPCTGEHVQ